MPRNFLIFVQVVFLISIFGRYELVNWSRLRRRNECMADEFKPWSYRGSNGPRFWGRRYSACDGENQSPIDIRNEILDPELPKIAMMNYDIPVSRAVIENNGYTVVIRPIDNVDRTIEVEGDIYNLVHFHFHWGTDSTRGSEHTVNGRQYALELHLVHEEAKDPVKKAVIAVLFEEVRHSNREFQNIVRYFNRVKYQDTRYVITTPFNLNDFVPANPSSFYRYPGSLTTPECNVGVTWSVLTEPLQVGKKQMLSFRRLYSARRSEASRNCRIANNFRPIQPLGADRTVRISQ